MRPVVSGRSVLPNRRSFLPQPANFVTMTAGQAKVSHTHNHHAAPATRDRCALTCVCFSSLACFVLRCTCKSAFPPCASTPLTSLSSNPMEPNGGRSWLRSGTLDALWTGHSGRRSQEVRDTHLFPCPEWNDLFEPNATDRSLAPSESINHVCDERFDGCAVADSSSMDPTGHAVS